MTSFLVIKDSKKNSNFTKIMDSLVECMKKSGYNTFSRCFAFDGLLPILSQVDGKKIDYIIIDVPKRVKFSKLFSQIVLRETDLINICNHENSKNTLTKKKIRLPRIVLLAGRNSIDVPSKEIPDFVEDIIIGVTNTCSILTKLEMIIKRRSLLSYNEYKSERLLRIFNNSDIMMFELKIDYSITFANKNALNVLKKSYREIKNKNFFEVIAESKDYEKSLKNIFENHSKNYEKNRFSFESLITNRDNNDILVRWFIDIPEGVNVPKMLTVVGHEITKEMSLAEQSHRYMKEINETNDKLTKTIKLYRKELKIAKRVQNGIIPKNFPQIKGVKISAIYVPMDDIGGDFYDVFNYTDSFSFIISDVVGHGVPAALITSMVKVLSDSSASRLISPKDFMRTLNDELNNLLIPGHFLTMFALYYNYTTKTLRYTSGGHPPQIFCRTRTNEILTLESTGPILGAIPESVYDHYEIKNIEKGDRMIAFTDGVIETKNLEGDLFGLKRLIASIQKNYHKDIEEFKQSILNEIAEFSSGVEVADDVSFVVIEFT